MEITQYSKMSEEQHKLARVLQPLLSPQCLHLSLTCQRVYLGLPDMSFILVVIVV